MSPYVCTNCGFWQRSFAMPTSCPVCLDFRHTPAEDGFEFWSAEEAARNVNTVWRRGRKRRADLPQRTRPRHRPQRLPASRCPAATCYLKTPPGIPKRLWRKSRLVAACAGWRRRTRTPTAACGRCRNASSRRRSPSSGRIYLGRTPFKPTTRTTNRWSLRRASNFATPAVISTGTPCSTWRERRTLFAGDMVKFHLAENPPGISTHKGFNRRIPMSHAEIRRYREVVESLDFDETYTTFEHAPKGVGTRAAVLGLLPDPVAWRFLLWPRAAGPSAGNRETVRVSTRPKAATPRPWRRTAPLMLRRWRRVPGASSFRKPPGPAWVAACGPSPPWTPTGRFPTASVMARRWPPPRPARGVKPWNGTWPASGSAMRRASGARFRPCRRRENPRSTRCRSACPPAARTRTTALPWKWVEARRCYPTQRRVSCPRGIRGAAFCRSRPRL